MIFNRLNEEDKAHLKSLVSPERFSTGESNLDLHSRDMSRHTPVRPDGVLWPLDREEVSKVLGYCNRRRLPVTAWGAGSSLEGNPIPVKGGVVLDFSRMNRVLDVRVNDFQADVEPGVIYQDLNHRLRHTGLFFPPDPGARATIGGMIGNNASGTRTVRYGSTNDHVLRLVVVLAHGQIMEVGNRAAKSSSGYDLLHLFIGSEGMLGVVVEATVRLVGLPEEFASLVATFASVEEAAKAVFEIIRTGVNPAAVELLSPECIGLINRETALGLEANPTLWVELHGPTKNQLAEALEIIQGICGQEGCRNFRPGLERDERDRLLHARHKMGEMIRQNHPGYSRMTIDAAVPISTYPQIIAFARKEASQVGSPLNYLFGHAGDGNIHLSIGAKDGAPEWEKIHRVNERVVGKALELGGTATGEHGVGIGKTKFMGAEHRGSLEWMRRVKALFDPNGILNPGKMFPEG